VGGSVSRGNPAASLYFTAASNRAIGQRVPAGVPQHVHVNLIAGLFPMIGWTELAFELFQGVTNRLPILYE
jgi:hypothetical protein